MPEYGRVGEDPAEPVDVFVPLRARRTRVRGPVHAPGLEEVLLDPGRGHLREHAESSELRTLMGDQLRLAVAVVGGFFGTVVLTVVLIASGWAGRLTVAGVPVEWLLPGALLTPALLFAGWVFIRGTEAREARWAADASPEHAAPDAEAPGRAPATDGRDPA